MTRNVPAFPFTHRGIAGHITTPIGRVADDTWGWTEATITGVRHFGTGNSLRVRLVLTADNDTTTTAVIGADELRRTPDFLRTRGARVEVRGVIRTEAGVTVIDVAGIAPAGTSTAPVTALAA
ncbi:hypothetical protein [Streptomyces olivaceiscleroticus]|uniref:Uncharacterized protein n=1 Tax=Streptomyces olivaceiscleroticus TaxID=68245 RepID=A0ABP3LHT8_9ACTN